MEKLAVQIANILQKNNRLTGANHGLMHGNMGLSIFFYHLSRHTFNPDYEKIADDLLDQVFANLSTTVTADFENGLAGIGWGIEYLVHNKFADGNTDEILEEVDNRIFRVLNEDSFASFELTNGLTGFLFYLVSRLKNKPDPKSLASRINRELLIVTINKLDEIITAQFPSIVKEMNFDLFWRFPVLFYGLLEAFRLDIYNYKIVNMVRQWLPYLEAYIPSLNINRLFLSLVLDRLYELIPEDRLKRQVLILCYATDFEIMKTEVDYGLCNLRLGKPGVLFLLKHAVNYLSPKCPNYFLIQKTYSEITFHQANLLKNFMMDIPLNEATQYGISNGIAGIGLTELLWPEVLTGNRISNTI